jgi:hypothetical protein
VRRRRTAGDEDQEFGSGEQRNVVTECLSTLFDFSLRHTARFFYSVSFPTTRPQAGSLKFANSLEPISEDQLSHSSPYTLELALRARLALLVPASCPARSTGLLTI